MEKVVRNSTTDSHGRMSDEYSLSEQGTASEEIFCQLSKQTDIKVLQMLAIHPQIPEEVLGKLAKDSRMWPFLSQNPKTPQKFLEFLAQFRLPAFREIRMNVAENPNTPVSVLEELAHDTEPFVRRRVASNPRTPRLLLNELKKDPDGQTSLNARIALKKQTLRSTAFITELPEREEESLHSNQEKNTDSERRQREITFECQSTQRSEFPQTVILHLNLPAFLGMLAVIILLRCVLLLV